MTQKILFARAVDDHRTAIVIDDGRGNLIGGVAIMSVFQNDYRAASSINEAFANRRAKNITRTRIELHWQWTKDVKESDFANGIDSLFDEAPSLVVESEVIEAKAIDVTPSKKKKSKKKGR